MIEITICLDETPLKFVDQQSSDDRSRFINAVLAQHRKNLEAEMIASLQQDFDDPEYRAEVKAWDTIAGD